MRRCVRLHGAVFDTYGDHRAAAGRGNVLRQNECGHKGAVFSGGICKSERVSLNQIGYMSYKF